MQIGWYLKNKMCFGRFRPQYIKQTKQQQQKKEKKYIREL